MRARTVMCRLVAVMALGAVSVGCSGESEPAAVDGGVRVVASDPLLEDLVRRVAGDAVEVATLVPDGETVRTYEPRDGDVALLADADVFVENGRERNPELATFAHESLRDDALYVQLADAIPEEDVIFGHLHEHAGGEQHGHRPNPHLWSNVAYTMVYVDVIADALSIVDSDSEEAYRANAAQVNDELEALDEAIADAVDTVPADERQLLVFYDAWSYFGQRYDLPVRGTLLPGERNEASPLDAVTMAQQIKAADADVFFGSALLPADLAERIEEESGATYVADLTDDVLPGDPGDPEHSYAGMMTANTRAIVEALGGDPSPLDGVDPARR